MHKVQALIAAMRPSVAAASMLALSLGLCACGTSSTQPYDPEGNAGAAGSGPTPPQCSVDQDGDGYGIGCANGADCDDSNPQLTRQCYDCVPLHAGCGCSQEGQKVACGEVASQVGTQTSCIPGERTCTGGKWSDCIPTGAPAFSPKALGQSTGCTNNPCDPYCQHFPDTPEPGIAGLGPDVQVTNNGVTLIPGPISGGASQACVSETAQAEPLPLDIYMIVDTSGSMHDPYVEDAEDRWTPVQNAIINFVSSPDSRGIGFGIQKFPLPASGGIANDDPMCTISHYSTPDVEIGTLEGPGSSQANAVVSHLSTWQMGGRTPTPAALQGALDHAVLWSQLNPTHKVVIVLATDGAPNSCPYGRPPYDMSSLNATLAIASQGVAGANGRPSIPTYVIGVGDDAGIATLHQIARAGLGITDTSATPAYIVGATDGQAFLNAMNDIRRQAISCSFAIPTPSSGVIDPNATTLSFTPSTGGAAATWNRVTSAADCVSGQNGWYYDDPNFPNRVNLCPTSCNALRADLQGTVNFRYSCINDCNPRLVRAAPQPLNMYLALDRSGSMNNQLPYSGGITRWQRIADALRAFTSDPGSEGIDMGMAVYPQWVDDTPCGNTACSTYHYYPTVVPLGHLVTPNAALLSTALSQVRVCGGTPTISALRGAYYTASQWANSNHHKTIVVLATDGAPTECDNDCQNCYDAAQPLCTSRCCISFPVLCDWTCRNDCITAEQDRCGWPYAACTTPHIAAAAAAARAATPPITTYVIGAGVDTTTQDYLNAIAASGGTGQALIANDTDPTAFVRAMTAIRTAELPCEFNLPAPAIGQLNPSATHVIFTPGTGTNPETWPHLNTAADCRTDADGWYYNNNTTPTAVDLCPHSCGRHRSDINSTIEFQYECLGEYAQSTFVREYNMDGSCGTGTAPVWGFWFWQVDTPSNSRVDFEVSVRQPDGVFSAYVPLQFVRTNPAPAWWSDSLAGRPIGAQSATNTQQGFTVVDTTLALSGLTRQPTALRIRANLIPSSNHLASPTLRWWDMQVSCQPSE